MGIFSDFFKKPEISYQESVLRQPTESGIVEAVGDIGNLQPINIDSSEYLSSLTDPLYKGLEGAIGRVSAISPYAGDIAVDPSQSLETGRSIVGERAISPYVGLSDEAFQKYQEDVLDAFDIETPESLKPIVEANISSGTLTSGAGRTDITRGLTERAKQKASLASGLGRERLEFQERQQRDVETARQKNLDNLFRYGTQEEQREASNLMNQANVFFKNQGLTQQQANTLGGIIATVARPEEQQQINLLLQEWQLNKNLPMEKMQALNNLMRTILSEEGARTGVAASNVAAQSPFQQALTTGISAVGTRAGLALGS